MERKTENQSLTDRVLDAAEAVVVRQGIGNLTLDAVASEAGISKGGLLHHFASKDRLIEAMVLRCAQGWRECVIGAYEAAEPGRGRMARAMRHAVEAGRLAYLAGRMGQRRYADPSSPLAGLI